MKNDAEISRKLALAVGWKHVKESPAGIRALVSETGNMWYAFDYRDPAVIWPIAEKFDAFPRKSVDNPKGWASVTSEFWINGGEFSYADTAAKAVALAVIKHCEGK